MDIFGGKMLDIRRQEILYFNSNFLNRKWYRRIFGGKWTLLKLGKDLPDIMLFCVWTKLPEYYDKTCYQVDVETYPETYVDTRFKMIKQLFKQIFKIN